MKKKKEIMKTVISQTTGDKNIWSHFSKPGEKIMETKEEQF